MKHIDSEVVFIPYPPYWHNVLFYEVNVHYESMEFQAENIFIFGWW